ncbi:MAG: hypothetical protein U0133_07070 [Gemmatimonadales bacterium]
MALDATLLDLAESSGVGFLRLYRWSPHCLSFGRHEPARRRYDRALIEQLGLDLVRRPTGGRAVWHARELTYAVAAPIAWFGGLAESYRMIHAVLAEAVRSLGAEATLAPATPVPGVGAGACFASPAGGEVLVGGRKLVGSAQLRQGTAFLQHGSLLLEDDQATVTRVTLGEAPPSDDTPLARALGRAVSFAEAGAAVERAFAGAATLAAGAPPPADPRHLARFRDPAWTWQR